MNSFRAIFMLAFTLHAVLAAPKLTVEKSNVQDDSDHFLQDLSKMGKDLQNSLMKVVPSTKDVSKLLISASQQFADAVDNITKYIKLYTKKHQGTMDNSLKDISSQLSQAAALLKKISNDVPEKANDIVDTVSVQAQNILAEASQVQEAVKHNLKDVQENVMSVAEKFYTEILGAYTHLQKDVSQAWQRKP